MKSTIHAPKLTIYLVCIALISLVSGCYKDSQDVIVEEKPNPQTVIVSGDLAVAVTDETGSDIAGVTLQFDSQTKVSDGPLTHFSATDVNKYHEVMRVTNAYYEAVPFHIFTRENAVSYPQIALIKSPEQSTFSSSSTGHLSAENFRLSTTADAFLLDGQPFSGEITVKGFTQTISTPEDLRFMPGNKLATNSDGETGVLIPRFLAAFNAIGSGNEALSFVQGKARVHFLNDCASCFVWKMNDAGEWTLIPDAPFVPNGFTFYPEETGFYCVAGWAPHTTLTGHVMTNGKQFAGVSTHIAFNGQPIASLRTTNEGLFEAFVPSNSLLDLTLQSPCGSTVVYSAETTSTPSTNTFDVWDEISVSKVEGITRDCADNILPAHFLEINSGGKELHFFLNNGEFALLFPVCADVFTLESHTVDWSMHGPSIPWKSNPETNIYSTYACENALYEYFVFRIKDDRKLYWNTQSAWTAGQRTQLTADDPLIPDTEASIWITGMETGNFEDMELNILFEDKTINTGYSLYCPTSSAGCGFEKFEITHFGETGEWIRGYFEGTFWVKTFQPLTAGNKKIAGEFQIYRDF